MLSKPEFESFHRSQAANWEHLRAALNEYWALGRNLVLLWAENGHGLEFLVVPYISLVEQGLLFHPEGIQKKTTGLDVSENFLLELLAGPRKVTLEVLLELATCFNAQSCSIQFPCPEEEGGLPEHVIDEVVRQYSVDFDFARAVILFDIVGFSSFTSLEQICQINSLAYSLNWAHSKLLEKQIRIRFAHSTTGDGFYVWNREPSVQANTDLYHLMHLTLAHNAVARMKHGPGTVPSLKTAFLIGSYYRITQTEGLEPTRHDYIVGDATIRLARIMERALPGQVLMGDFKAQPQKTGEAEKSGAELDPVGLIEKLQGTLATLSGIEIDNQEIALIKCYLTGEAVGLNEFNIKRRQILDKHGNAHLAYNAKVNFHRKQGAPIYLGIQEKELKERSW